MTSIVGHIHIIVLQVRMGHLEVQFKMYTRH